MYLRPSKPTASTLVVYMCALFYVAIPVCAVIGVVTKHLCLAVPVVIMSIVLIILNKLLGWYICAKIEKSGNKLVYEVTEILDVLGHNKTKYEITAVDGYKIKGKNITIWGSINVFEFLKKGGKSVKKLTIYDYNEKVLEMINELKSK